MGTYKLRGKTYRL